MKKLAIFAFGLASLLLMPAVGRTGSAFANSPSSAENGSSATTAPQNVPQVRQNIINQLEKDGFKDVRVVPDSFLVNAKNKEGQPVVMIINPNSVFSVTEVPGNTNRTSASASK